MSNTDLFNFSIVGTCEILVYQMHHEVMWFARLVDSILCHVASLRDTETLL